MLAQDRRVEWSTIVLVTEIEFIGEKPTTKVAYEFNIVVSGSLKNQFLLLSKGRLLGPLVIKMAEFRGEDKKLLN